MDFVRNEYQRSSFINGRRKIAGCDKNRNGSKIKIHPKNPFLLQSRSKKNNNNDSSSLKRKIECFVIILFIALIFSFIHLMMISKWINNRKWSLFGKIKNTDYIENEEEVISSLSLLSWTLTSVRNEERDFETILHQSV